MKLELNKIEDMEFNGIDHSEGMRFTDAYCSSAYYKGQEMSDELLEVLNDEYSDFVYESLLKWLY